MSIYDFIEYLTKEKNIYIDIKQFKRQLRKLKSKKIVTVGELLNHNKDFLFHQLDFNIEMLDEVSTISVELTGQDIGELTKERSEAYLEGNNSD